MLFAKDINFVSDVLISHLPLKRRKSNTGYLNINCPMCHIVGNHRPDTKMRCGIMINPTSIEISCFNCHFKTDFVLGNTFTRKFKSFMQAIGIDELTIKKLNHAALTLRGMLQGAGIEIDGMETFVPTFQPMKLPEGAKSFHALAQEGCEDRDFLDVVEYLYDRGEELADSTTFYWTPSKEKGMNRRVIIPFYYDEMIVGYTGRIIDKNTKFNRYESRVPSNYLFNNHVLKKKTRAFVTVQEGPTDALAIDGIGTLGAKLNEHQAQWLKSSGKTIIVVPDRDESGQALIDVALKNNWFVAFPRNFWEPDVKDTAEAVRRYGRLYTLTSIVKSATNQVARINVLRRLK